MTNEDLKDIRFLALSIQRTHKNMQKSIEIDSFYDESIYYDFYDDMQDIERYTNAILNKLSKLM